MHKVIQPYILDIEASGFGPDSYPIEIGVVLREGKRWCSLIKPEDEWRHWDSQAESIHHIRRQTLVERGLSVGEIARELNALLAGKIVYSDGWVVDEPWLIKLFAAASIDRRFSIYDLQTILSEAQMRHWQRVKAEVEAELQLCRHRATNDARIIQETYMRTQQL